MIRSPVKTDRHNQTATLILENLATTDPVVTACKILGLGNLKDLKVFDGRVYAKVEEMYGTQHKQYVSLQVGPKIKIWISNKAIKTAEGEMNLTGLIKLMRKTEAYLNEIG